MYKLPVLECCGQFCTFCYERGLPCQCSSAASQWAQHLSSKSPVQEEAEQDLHIPWLPVSCSEGGTWCSAWSWGQQRLGGQQLQAKQILDICA